MNLAPYGVKDMATGGVVPESTCRLRVKKFEYRDPNDPEFKKKNPNSKAKEPGLQVWFVIQDEEAEDKDGNVHLVLGRNIITNLTFKRGGDFMLRQFIEACGKEEDWMLIDDMGVPHWDELVDAEVMGVVVIRPEQGEYQEKNEIKKFFSVF